MRAVSALQSRNARNIDDGPGLAHLHDPGRVLEPDEYAALDDVARIVVLVYRNTGNGSHHTSDGRVVDQAIESSPAANCRIECVRKLVFGADIESREGGTLAKLSGKVRALLDLKIAECHVVALRHEAAYAGGPYAACATGNKTDRTIASHGCPNDQ